jgi:hypothetical protein
VSLRSPELSLHLRPTARSWAGVAWCNILAKTSAAGCHCAVKLFDFRIRERYESSDLGKFFFQQLLVVEVVVITIQAE